MTRDVWGFVKFVAAGLANTAFGYASYAALVLVGLPIWLTVTIATGLAILFNFYSYGGFVFGSTARALLPRFILFYGLLGLCNYVGLKLLIGAGFGPLIAQALLLPMLAVGGYFGMRRLVFRGTGVTR